MDKLIKNQQILYYKIVEKNIKHTYFKPQNGYLLINKSVNMPIELLMKHLNQNFSKYLKLTEPISDNNLYLWGEKYDLIILKTNNFTYSIKDNQIIVKTPFSNIKHLKVSILTKEMKKYLKANKNKYNDKLNKFNLKMVPIQLKYLKSKFGSYHYLTEKIILNVFLATLPKQFTDYVIFHEYAHQKESNHKKGFYNLLKKLDKDYKVYDQKLKKITIKI